MDYGVGDYSSSTLLASYQTANDQSCGNASGALYHIHMKAAIRYTSNEICERWYIFDITTGNIPPATSPSTSATFIAFDTADLGANAPTLAANWGVFTCPEGSWNEGGACYYGTSFRG